ncbi:hypothetical protein [Streptomyces alkaliphilus]|uniref:hypothetical protein n=1 Tax=Streptomyces alkaliphilus TaxID=1472722 RepID=UPI0015FB377A|nr:hypothetical protein [Streptomyces alkaliphilus]
MKNIGIDSHWTAYEQYTTGYLEREAPKTQKLNYWGIVSYPVSFLVPLDQFKQTALDGEHRYFRIGH